MKLLFDYQAFNLQQYGGVSRCYCEMIPLLKEKFECTISVRESDNIHLHESGLIDNLKYCHHINWGRLNKYNFIGKHRINRLYEILFSNKTYSIKKLKEQNFDLFEPTFYETYFLEYLKDKPFVLNIHDMIPELFPKYFPNDTQAEHKRILCPLATHIFAPTERTKEDLINILNINPEKISIIYRGLTSLPTPDKNILKNKKPYLLYVGTRLNYKNFIPFVNSFSNIIKKRKDLQLICTGPNFSNDEIKLIKELNIGDNIHHIFADSNKLSSLYSNASAFVFPSLYEGFGLPILEAWSMGCPVLLNNASCFPEVAGDAALYFEMNETKNDFVEVLDCFLDISDEERYNLIQKGFDRLTKYSWKNTTDMISETYNSIF